ncbi:MAG: Rpn family recombination-promoting nuclease/putative transposase [Firmicutes bacterium]|nr:Rpn family recombination-promoting nuclease/putative transposase [Bacillota bacterium]
MDLEHRLHEQDLQRLRGFRIFDDDFLGAVFEDNYEATELLLNVLFNRKDMKVSKTARQREIKGLEGHSVRLDISAEDSDRRVYDIEIQRQDKGDLQLRSRYYSSLLDTTLLQKNEGYDKLVPTYVIFFMEKNMFDDSRPLRHYVMKELEDNGLLGDDRHIMFVNGDNKDESTALGRLIHDFKCTAAKDMYYDVLAQRVRYFKETEGGIRQMCKVMEDMRREAAIYASIETARYCNLKEEEIKKMIMEMYSLDADTADNYLLKKGA